MVHQGPDRIELAPALGRPLRQGSWTELSVSDRARVLQAIRSHDPVRAATYLGYLAAGQAMMLHIAYEWALRWLEFAGTEAGQEGHRAFQDSLSGSEEQQEGQAVGRLLENPQSVKDYLAQRLSGEPTRLDGVIPDSARILELVGEGGWDPAAREFEQAFRAARWLHDLLFRHSWAVMSALGRFQGQPRVEAGLRAVLTGSSFYEAAWQQSAGLTPQELAVTLAEHLRLHFSGPAGSGAVEVAEEEDRIRLVMDPCGSGGAMRRNLKGHPGFDRLEQATPMTWGRAGQVPAYCAHCALNELESVRRLGYPAWVTNFDPDPDQPCGWTIFKDPSRIPEEYLGRLR